MSAHTYSHNDLINTYKIHTQKYTKYYNLVYITLTNHAINVRLHDHEVRRLSCVSWAALTYSVTREQKGTTQLFAAVKCPCSK